MLPPRTTLLLPVALVVAVSSATLLSGAAPDDKTDKPIKLSTVISRDDLQAEAASVIAQVRGLLKSEATYADSAKHELPRAAGVLAVLGQACSEHDTRTTATDIIRGTSFRDAALALKAARSLQAAQAALARLESSFSGKTTKGGPTKRTWKGLISLHDVMEELAARNSKLRRAVRRSRDPKADSRNAATMAVLGLVVLADSHEVRDEADIPKWNRLSLEFQRAASATAAALRAENKAMIKPLYLKTAKSCSDCHADFRSE